MWTQQEAIALCAKLEDVCPACGCHVALTGGLLYKDGFRKDCDILLYRIRQVPKINMDGLSDALAKLGIVDFKGFGWCYKASFNGKPLDFFFPEEEGGEYIPEESEPLTASEGLLI